MLIVSHDLEMIATNCDEAALLEAGSLLTVGPVEHTLDRYRHRGAVDSPRSEQQLYGARGKTMAARRRRGA